MPSARSTETLERIIEKNILQAVLQPIIHLNSRSVYGYESLIRGPVESDFFNPVDLFKEAKQRDLLFELEKSAIQTSCQHFNANGKLFLNINPVSLLDSRKSYSEISQIISLFEISAENTVIELTEQYPLEDYTSIRETINLFRAEGYQIALDDFGSGYSGLRTWSELKPDYLKIDMHFIKEIHFDSVKQEFVRAIQEMASEFGCHVIAEGIETLEELEVVEELGIPFAQGYLIGKPQAEIEETNNIHKRIGLTCLPKRVKIRQKITAEQLALDNPYIRPITTLTEVNDIFQNNKTICCLAIVEDRKPIGIVNRNEITELFSQRYCRELYGRKSISQFINTMPIIVEHDSGLEEISRLLTDIRNDILIQNFVVTQNGLYRGVGKTSTLLKQLTEQKMKNAQYANPLTLLPGNVPIHEHVEDKLKAGEEFYIAYFDLNNFKPYNDHYGYSKGDDVLIDVANLLVEHSDSKNDFIGHIGGDDFVVIFSSEDWKMRCYRILDQFSKNVERFYSEQSKRDKGIWGLSRTGEKQFFEFTGLAVGVAKPNPKYCFSYHDVVALAVDAKKQAKLLKSNTLFYSRREKPDVFNQPVVDHMDAEILTI